VIKLRKIDKSREQYVYKTKGPDITTENIQFPILRAMGGEKLEEMGKSWEMIYELQWDNELGHMRGTKKNDGLKVDGTVRKMYNGEEQYVAKEHHMGVTPRGVDYNDWEENITTVASRKLLTEENEEERVRTDKEERKSQDSDLIQTATHSTEKHPVLLGWNSIYAQLEKEDAHYEFRSRHEQSMMHLDYKFYIPNNCLGGYVIPIDCSFYDAPVDPREAHHRKFGTNSDTMLRAHDKRTVLRKKNASGTRTKLQFPCSKIERRSGERKDYRWEKYLSEGEQKIKNARRAHKSQRCEHCDTMITQKANRSQAWIGPPGAHEDCDKFEQIHTKMEYHLIHQCKIYKPKEAQSEEHKRKRAATGGCMKHPKKHNSSGGYVPQ
jgi:hypothetical protein